MLLREDVLDPELVAKEMALGKKKENITASGWQVSNSFCPGPLLNCSLPIAVGLAWITSALSHLQAPRPWTSVPTPLPHHVMRKLNSTPTFNTYFSHGNFSSNKGYAESKRKKESQSCCDRSPGAKQVYTRMLLQHSHVREATSNPAQKNVLPVTTNLFVHDEFLS